MKRGRIGIAVALVLAPIWLNQAKADVTLYVPAEYQSTSGDLPSWVNESPLKFNSQLCQRWFDQVVRKTKKRLFKFIEKRYIGNGLPVEYRDGLSEQKGCKATVDFNLLSEEDVRHPKNDPSRYYVNERWKLNLYDNDTFWLAETRIHNFGCTDGGTYILNPENIHIGYYFYSDFLYPQFLAWNPACAVSKK